MNSRKINFNKVRRYFNVRSQSDDPGTIDDITVKDLHLEEIFEKLDRTITSVGQAYLYYLLRTQCTCNSCFEIRQNTLHYFQKNEDTKRTIEKYLQKVGFQHVGDITVDLWYYKQLKQTNLLIPLRIWIAFSIAALFSPILLGIAGFLYIIIPVFIINIIIYARTKLKVSAYAGSIFYLLRLIWSTKKVLRTVNSDSLNEVLELAEIYNKVKKLSKNVFFFQPSKGFAGDPISILIEYLKVFFLGELHAFLSIYHHIGIYLKEFRRLYDIFGAFDAYINIVNILNENDLGLCFADCNEKRTQIDIKNMTHPLIANCVSNSLSLNTGMIVTGTNMSGKSTFLRTVGVNQVLATSLGIAFAKDFRTGFHCVLTSIVTVDNLLEKQSKYFAEAKRLLKLLRRIESEHGAHLLLIDEILAGTNSEDRIKASIRIL